MTSWNFADLWEAIARVQPDAPVQIHGTEVITWAEFDRRADGLAATLRRAGVSGNVGQYMYNGPTYLQSFFGACKIGRAPVNTNYRYVADELEYLWANADVEAVIFDPEFAERVDEVRPRLPQIKAWLCNGDASATPEWATPVTDATNAELDRSGLHRSEHDLVLLYTGGTTGMPKGVMWRQDDLVRRLAGTTHPLFQDAPPRHLDGPLAEAISDQGRRSLPACPLMHGTGLFTQLLALSVGGVSVTVPNRKLDIEELLRAIERSNVTDLTIPGDVVARPLLATLNANPDRWDLSTLVRITSSGMMWSAEVKAGLLEHNSNMVLIDMLSSSEALGLGHAVTTSEKSTSTARFRGGRDTIVLTEDGREVTPGSGEIGRVAVGGHQPIGYYKDATKTAQTFVTHAGRRYSMPGDFATVAPDGTIELLGRGSACINTGGEKVFAEEVEEALKAHPAIHDAIVVGLPDERFGEVVTALVQLEVDQPLDEDGVRDHLRERLAGYKLPKHILAVSSTQRAANGKLDYKAARQRATELLAPR